MAQEERQDRDVEGKDVKEILARGPQLSLEGGRVLDTPSRPLLQARAEWSLLGASSPGLSEWRIRFFVKPWDVPEPSSGLKTENFFYC